MKFVVVTVLVVLPADVRPAVADIVTASRPANSIHEFVGLWMEDNCHTFLVKRAWFGLIK